MKILQEEWKQNAIYKRWELYLYRLFKLAEYLETTLKLYRLNAPPLEEILDPNGYDDGSIRIPPNPFIRRDENVFLIFYDHFIDYGYSEKEKDRRDLYFDVWDRLSDLKVLLGITKGTRFLGEEKEEGRLFNELSLYIDFYEDAPMIHRIVLGDPSKYKKDILRFKKFLGDRRYIKGVRSLASK